MKAYAILLYNWYKFVFGIQKCIELFISYGLSDVAWYFEPRLYVPSKLVSYAIANAFMCILERRSDNEIAWYN